jgi:Acetyltransferase (GNAT) domain
MDFKILREFPPSDVERAWRDYLSRIEFPSHYESPGYFLEPLWSGKQRFAVLAVKGGKIFGVLTGLHTGKGISCGLPARPQVSVDPANAEEALEVLVKGLMAESKSAELVNVFTWPSLELPTFTARGFRRRQLPGGNVVLDLTLGAEALFKQFTKDRRRNIRFAEKNGVVVTEAATAQDVADAYVVYSAWRSTVRKTVVGDKLDFEAYEKSQRLKENRRLFIARVEGKAVAINGFRFYPGGLFESSSNASLDEFIHFKPNDLLQWKGIEWACSNGLRRHSLGGSHQFLARFGGTVIPILRYRLDRTWLHRHDLRDKAMGVGREIIRKLPPSMERRIRKLSHKEK